MWCDPWIGCDCCLALLPDSQVTLSSRFADQKLCFCLYAQVPADYVMGENCHTVMDGLVAIIFHHGDERTKARAMLCSIYHKVRLRMKQGLETLGCAFEHESQDQSFSRTDWRCATETPTQVLETSCDMHFHGLLRQTCHALLSRVLSRFFPRPGLNLSAGFLCARGELHFLSTSSPQFVQTSYYVRRWAPVLLV